MIWSIQSGKLIRILTGHTWWIKSVALSNNSNKIVSGSKDKTIKIWHLYNGANIMTLVGHKHCIASVIISRNEKYIISGS